MRRDLSLCVTPNGVIDKHLVLDLDNFESAIANIAASVHEFAWVHEAIEIHPANIKQAAWLVPSYHSSLRDRTILAIDPLQTHLGAGSGFLSN